MHGRLKREHRTLQVMVAMYCRSQHGANSPCAECASLLRYAEERLAKCPYGAGKTTCAKCPTHCYHPQMRAKIVPVMRYSGPRLMLRHPLLAIAHLMDGKIRRTATRKGRGKSRGG